MVLMELLASPEPTKTVFEDVASIPSKAIHVLPQHSSHTVLAACAQGEHCEIGKNISQASSCSSQACCYTPPEHVVELSEKSWPCA